MDVYITTIWHHLPEYTVFSSSKFSHCLTQSLTFNIFGFRLTRGLNLMWNLTANALGDHGKHDSCQPKPNESCEMRWLNVMWFYYNCWWRGGWHGALSISGVSVVTQPSPPSFLVRLPMGWRGRCIWRALGLQQVSLCADLTHVKMGADGENQCTMSAK